jgi:competence protein ComEA
MFMTRRLLQFCFAVSILSVTPARAQTALALPDGEGKALVQKACSKCHGLVGIIRARNSKEAWAGIVDDMVSRGAEGSDEELEVIIDYLAKNFSKDKPPAPMPKVNVNKITPAGLAAALAVPKDVASAIVDYREKNGPFKKWEDLEKVPGLDMKKIQSEKDRFEFAEK